MYLGTNISSLAAIRALGNAQASVAESSTRLASGQRINHASDDAAGLAIASSLNANARVLGQAYRNVNDGISSMSIAQSATGELQSIVTRQKELAEQSANGVYSLTQRNALNREAAALVAEFNRIIESTSFNGQKLLDGSNRQISLQVGSTGQSTLSLEILSTTSILQPEGTTSTTSNDGTFGALSQSAMTTPYWLSFGDIDGDTDIDVSFYNNTPFFSLNGGSGNFSAPTTIQQGWSFLLDDFNSDGRTDRILTGIEWIAVSLANSGSAGFSNPVSYVVPTNTPYSLSVTAGDVNGDQTTDLIVGGTAAPGGNGLFYYLGNGDGTFQAPTSVNFDVSISSLTVGDVNGDDRLDIITGYSYDYYGAYISGAVFTILQQADGSFGAAQGSGFTGVHMDSLTVGDVNGDGKDDIIATTDDASSYLFKGSSTGLTPRTFLFDSGTSATQTSLVDMNGDSNLDLVSRSGNNALLAFGAGDGTFQAPQAISMGVLATGDIHVADMNGDGANDLIATGIGNINIRFGNTQTVTVSTESVSSSQMVALLQDSLDLSTQASARLALESLTEKALNVNAVQGQIGAALSRLEIAAQQVSELSVTVKTAAGRIQDADVAQESAALIRAKILQDVGSAVLAQANQAPQLALSLLRSAGP